MNERLGVLDGLRGIAVFLVLWYHVWEISWLQVTPGFLEFVPETGFVGVHLFFFLSGFVISYPFLRARRDGLPSPGWAHFAWRRCIKIVPSYWLSIAVAFAIGYAATQGASAPVWRDVLAHLLFVHTWSAGTYGGINGVLWTLAVEVEFYCIFPLIWWCFSRRPVITAAAMVAIAYGWRVAASRCCYTGGFELLVDNLPGFLDIFAFGMLSSWFFVTFGRACARSRWQPGFPLLAIAGFVVLAELLMNLFGFRLADQWSTVWQVDKRTALGAVFAVIAIGSLLSPRWWQVVLANRVLTFLAAISYNLYLYHQMVARELLAWRIPPYVLDPHDDPRWKLTYTAVAFVSAIGVATLVTYGFERPIMRSRYWTRMRLMFAKVGHRSPV